MICNGGGSRQPAEAAAKALMQAVGREAGAELKQGERKALILLSRGHSQQERELGAQSAPTLLPTGPPWAVFA